jgi:ribosomal protein S18 acetylase RimI-like enzyme
LAVREEAWRRGLERGHAQTHVALVDGEIVGFISAHDEESEPGFDAYVSTLYVLGCAQRRGIARVLLRAVARDLIAAGRHAMWLLTLRDRNPAREFYERMGARLIREQPAPPELGAETIDVVYGFDDLRAIL